MDCGVPRLFRVIVSTFRKRVRVDATVEATRLVVDWGSFSFSLEMNRASARRQESDSSMDGRRFGVLDISNLLTNLGSGTHSELGPN